MLVDNERGDNDRTGIAQAGIVQTGNASRSTRAPWQHPVLKSLGACDAETGVNSTTDATATFS